MTIRTPAWVQAGSYTAENDRLAVQTWLSTQGVAGAGAFAVTPSSGLQLSVAPGWAAATGAGGSSGLGIGMYSTYSDTSSNVNVTSNSSGSTRIDLVILTFTDTQYSGATNSATLSVYAGTPGAGVPTTPANSIALAQITVANGAATIGTGQIADVRPWASTSLALAPIAGTTVQAPLKLTAGTNLTTQTAGAFEYDGNAVYATAGASGRSVANGSHYSVSPRSLTTGSTIQNLFSTGNGVLTLAASTTYEYELLLRVTISVSAPTVSSVVTMVTGATTTAHSATFDFGSNATSLATTSALNTATVSGTGTNAIAQTVASGLGAGTNYCTVKVRGIVQTSAATTLTPSITISGGTVSAAQLIAGSFVRVTPIGSSTVTSVGAWA